MTRTHQDPPKVVTVYGATGAQGGSVVRSLVQNKDFAVRAITRNPASKAAQALRDLGITVVQADGWKKDEITQAVAGSWAVFVNTNSEDPMFANENGPTELDHGKTIIDGIIAAGGVKHLLYSSAVSTSAYSNGQFRPKAAESKAAIERYAVDTGSFETVCPVYAGWYMELFLIPEMTAVFGGFPSVADDEGFVTLTAPRWGKETDSGIPWLSIEHDFGDIVHGVLLNPHAYSRRVIPALSDPSSFPEVAQALQKATGKKSRYVCQPSWKSLGAGIPELEDQRLLFGFGQLTGGKYFGDEPNVTTIPAALKAQAVMAQGKDPKKNELMTLERFFQEKFGAQN